jgi:hypothetical protein
MVEVTSSISDECGESFSQDHKDNDKRLCKPKLKTQKCEQREILARTTKNNHRQIGSANAWNMTEVKGSTLGISSKNVAFIHSIPSRTYSRTAKAPKTKPARARVPKV